MASVFRRFTGPILLLLVTLAFQTSGLVNVWVAVGFGVGAVIWGLIALITWKPVKSESKRIGIRMKGGTGKFRKTKIRAQDIAMDTKDTELDMKDTDIK